MRRMAVVSAPAPAATAVGVAVNCVATDRDALEAARTFIEALSPAPTVKALVVLAVAVGVAAN